jgi:hypothetical protein
MVFIIVLYELLRLIIKPNQTTDLLLIYTLPDSLFLFLFLFLFPAIYIINPIKHLSFY